MYQLGVLSIQLKFPNCRSLKDKRSRLKPLIIRLHREFNISVAEIDLQDNWANTIIACTMAGNDASHLQRSLESVRKWVEANWPDGQVIDNKIEIIK
jgi:hypothetical protein